MSEQWQRVNTLFNDALERPSGERARFVAEAAGEDEALRQEVLSLVAAHERAGSFLQQPVASVGSARVVGARSPGERVGSYVIERELGRGGMGIVYLAEDTRLGRKVALKALASRYTDDEQRRERLRTEARAAARLSHPGIATVFALEEIDGELFIACEYVAGRTLRAEMDAGPLPVGRLLELAPQLARALAAAHAEGVVHRDLKPENIACAEQGAVKILDFGVARSVPQNGASDRRLTEDGVVVGTPAYMSPEQLEAADVDFRSDIFSFGVLLYEMATGIHPFDTGRPTSTVARILSLDPVPPGELRRALPAGFDDIVRKCLQKRPDTRYQSAAVLAGDLERARTGDRPLNAAIETRTKATPGGRARPRGAPAAEARWWRVHQVAVVAVYAVGAVAAWFAAEWLRADWATVVFLIGVAAAVLNGTLRVHLLFTEGHNQAAFREELRRARGWLRASDVLLGIVLVALGLAIARLHITVAIAMAGIGAASIIISIAVEPATTEAAFPKRSSGVRRR